MEQFLLSPFFRYALFPVCSAVLGVAVKCATRNDRFASFRKEDLAVGLELILTAGLLFVVLTTDRVVALSKVNHQLAEVLAAKSIDAIRAATLQSQVQLLSDRLALAGWIIALLFLGLWSVSTVVRKWGWKSETEMMPLIGIALPLGFGILALIAVMAGAIQ